MTLTQIGFFLLLILLIFTTSVMITITILSTNQQTNRRIVNLQSEIANLRIELKKHDEKKEWWERD